MTFTPFICFFSKNAEIDPVPYLFGEFVAANTWSMLFIIGNPTNIYLAAGNGIDFAAYLRVMALPTVLGGVTSFAVLWLLFRRQLKQPMRPVAQEARLSDKPTVGIAVTALGACILFLILSSYMDLEMWMIAADACLLLFLVAIPELLIRRRGVGLVTQSLHRAPYDVVPFVLSMFILVMTLGRVGATAALAEFVLGGASLCRSGISSFFAANLLNNIPMSVLYSTVVSVQGAASLPALYAAVIGSNVGAFFTPMGALAGIVWVALLKQHKINFSFARFVIFGAAVSIPTLFSSLLGLSIVM